MGNMLINRRVEDAIGVSSDSDGCKEKQEEYRIFPDHMYKGPKKLGDPHFRGLSKMEEDPMVPQRMRDIARTQLCTAEVDTFSKCSRTAVSQDLGDLTDWIPFIIKTCYFSGIWFRL